MDSPPREIGYRAPFRRRLLDLVLHWPQSFYLIGIEVLTLIARRALARMAAICSYRRLRALFLLILPASQAAVDFMNNLTSYLAPPRALPKLDFSEGHPGRLRNSRRRPDAAVE